MIDVQTIRVVIGAVVAIVGLIFVLRNSGISIPHGRVSKVSAYLAITFLGIFIMIYEDSKFASAFQVFMILVIAFAAIYGIQKTSEVQMKQKRNTILREINEWSLEVGAALLKQGTPDNNFVNIDKKFEDIGSRGFIEQKYNDMEQIFNYLRMKSVYVQQITVDIKELKQDIDNCIYHLRTKLRLLHVYHKKAKDATVVNFDVHKAARNVALNEYNLYFSLVRLTEHVAKILTSD